MRLAAHCLIAIEHRRCVHPAPLRRNWTHAAKFFMFTRSLAASAQVAQQAPQATVQRICAEAEACPVVDSSSKLTGRARSDQALSETNTSGSGPGGGVCLGAQLVNKVSFSKF
jgi:hypothetical protein